MGNTDSTHAEGSLVRAIWRLELARARHLVRAYLRTRLQKLERHITAVLDDPDMQARLSPRELQYAKVGPSANSPAHAARLPAHSPARSCPG